MTALVRRLRSATFAAEQRALWPSREDKSAPWGTFDVALIVALAWLVYWAWPGTWRRIPAHLRAFIRIGMWWPLVRLVTRNPKYPWSRKR